MLVQPLALPSLKPMPLKVPLIRDSLACGFPNPAEGLLDSHLDLAEHLIKRPNATFFARAQGDSLINRGILDGALLIVDRSVQRKHGSIVIACLYGEYACKILDTKNHQLLSANPDFPPIVIPPDIDLIIEGVVVHCINHFDWS